MRYGTNSTWQRRKLDDDGYFIIENAFSEEEAGSVCSYPGELKAAVPARSIVFCNVHMRHSGAIKNKDERRRQLQPHSARHG